MTFNRLPKRILYKNLTLK